MTITSGSFPVQRMSWNRYHTDWNTGVTTVQGPFEWDVTGGGWTRGSTVTPGYRGYLLAGMRLDLPMNSLTYSNRKYWGAYGHSTRTMVWIPDGSTDIVKEVGYFANDSISLLHNPANTVFTDLQALAKSRLLSALKNQTVNLGIVVGEGRQTVNLITNKINQIAKAAIAVKRGNFGAAALALGVSPKGKTKKQRSHQTLAQNWLELQYGWKPLLADIYGAAEFLSHRNRWSTRTRIQASAHRTLSTSELVPQGNGIVDNTETYTVKYVVYFSEPEGGNPPVALGLVNPLAVAWELVPFSFLVDWFLPIGNYLNNLDATFGQVFVKGCVTTFWKGSAQVKDLADAPYVFGDIAYSHEVNKVRYGSGVECTRVPLTGFPSILLPQFKNPLSNAHLANGLALIAQTFR